MADIARQLREARHRAGLQIGDISARTKIKPAFIQAMERGEFERLPGHFFTRAFLKAYAHEVGLSPDKLVREFDESCAQAEADDLQALAAIVEHQPPKPPASRPSLQMPFHVTRLTAALVPHWPVAATIGVLIVVLSLLNVPTDTSMRETGAVGTSGIAEAASSEATPNTAARTPELVLDIRPTDAMWVAATADGERVIYRLLEPGEHVVVEAQREVSFRIGNAGAFKYAINGVPGKPLGGPGEVREFQVTPENHLTYRQ